MSKKITDVRFELLKVYKTFKDQLLISADISNLLIENSNIPSSGNQVESSIRTFLRQLLPNKIQVCQGHILDKKTKISYQQDILIADNYNSKSLIKTLDETEFLPYESIYATGEVKKTLNLDNIESLVKSIIHTKKLNRNKVAPNLFPVGSNYIKTKDNYTESDFANPLFTFMFSLDFTKPTDRTKIEKRISIETNWQNLPNAIFVLKQGLYILIDKEKIKNGLLEIKLYPEFVKDKKKYEWIFLKLEPEVTLAYMVFLLLQHINDTVIESVSYLEYAQSIFNISKANIYPINK
jgi:hypothetical protein